MENTIIYSYYPDESKPPVFIYLIDGLKGKSVWNSNSEDKSKKLISILNLMLIIILKILTNIKFKILIFPCFWIFAEIIFVFKMR